MVSQCMLKLWFHVSVSELEISRHTKLPRPFSCKIEDSLNLHLFIGRTKQQAILHLKHHHGIRIRGIAPPKSRAET
jgi:hypothetical protein